MMSYLCQCRLTNLVYVGGHPIGFSYGIGCSDREMYQVLSRCRAGLTQSSQSRVTIF